MRDLTLMAVHAHPDDEVTGTGGTLARYAAEGVTTVVVTCTDGRCGDGPNGVKPGEPGHVPDEVAALRRRELEASCAELKVTHLEMLGYHDSGMMGWATNEAPESFWSTPVPVAAERLAELIRRYRPDVLLTYDENGGYGHPDHIQVHRVTMAAAALVAADPVSDGPASDGPASDGPASDGPASDGPASGGPASGGPASGGPASGGPASGGPASGGPASGSPAKLYMSTLPRSAFGRIVERMHEMGIVPDGPAPADQPPMGWPDEEITAWIDVSGTIEQKFNALSAHASQGDGAFFLSLGRETFADVMGTECYVRVHDGPDALAREDDLFAGLR